jgi:hypothetical protein
MVPVLSSVNPSSEGMEEPSSLSKSLISHNINSSTAVMHYFNSCTILTTIYPLLLPVTVAHRTFLNIEELYHILHTISINSLNQKFEVTNLTLDVHPESSLTYV